MHRNGTQHVQQNRRKKTACQGSSLLLLRRTGITPNGTTLAVRLSGSAIQTLAPHACATVISRFSKGAHMPKFSHASAPLPSNVQSPKTWGLAPEDPGTCPKCLALVAKVDVPKHHECSLSEASFRFYKWKGTRWGKIRFYLSRYQDN